MIVVEIHRVRKKNRIVQVFSGDVGNLIRQVLPNGSSVRVVEPDVVVEATGAVDEVVAQVVQTVYRHHVDSLGGGNAVEQTEELVLSILLATCRKNLLELVKDDEGFVKRIQEAGDTVVVLVYKDDWHLKLVAYSLSDESNHERLAHALVA